MLCEDKLHLNDFEPVRLPSVADLARMPGMVKVSGDYSGDVPASVFSLSKVDAAAEVIKAAAEADLLDSSED